MTGRTFGATGHFGLGGFQPLGVAPAAPYRPAPRRRMGQGTLCCQAAPGNRVVCSSGYIFDAN